MHMQRYRAELLLRASTLQLERAHIETVFTGVNELYEAHARMLEQFRGALLPPSAESAAADSASASASASTFASVASTASTTQPPAAGAAATVAGVALASSNTGANSTVGQSTNGASASNGTSADEVMDSATLGDIFYANVCNAVVSSASERHASYSHCLQEQQQEQQQSESA